MKTQNTYGVDHLTVAKMIKDHIKTIDVLEQSAVKWGEHIAERKVQHALGISHYATGKNTAASPKYMGVNTTPVLFGLQRPYVIKFKDKDGNKWESWVTPIHGWYNNPKVVDDDFGEDIKNIPVPSEHPNGVSRPPEGVYEREPGEQWILHPDRLAQKVVARIEHMNNVFKEFGHDEFNEQTATQMFHALMEMEKEAESFNTASLSRFK